MECKKCGSQISEGNVCVVCGFSNNDTSFNDIFSNSNFSDNTPDNLSDSNSGDIVKDNVNSIFDNNSNNDIFDTNKVEEKKEEIIDIVQKESAGGNVNDIFNNKSNSNLFDINKAGDKIDDVNDVAKKENVSTTYNNIFDTDSVENKKEEVKDIVHKEPVEGKVNDIFSTNKVEDKIDNVKDDIIVGNNISGESFSKSNVNSKRKIFPLWFFIGLGIIIIILGYFIFSKFPKLSGENYKRSEMCRKYLKEVYIKYENDNKDVKLIDGTCIIISTNIMKVNFKVMGNEEQIVGYSDNSFYVNSMSSNDYKMALSYSEDDMYAYKHHTLGDNLMNSFYYSSSEILK